MHLKEWARAEAKKYCFPCSIMSFSPLFSSESGRPRETPQAQFCSLFGVRRSTSDLQIHRLLDTQRQYVSPSDCAAVPGLSCHTAVSMGYSSMTSGRDTGYKAILPFQRNYSAKQNRLFSYSIRTEKLKKWSICYKGILINQRMWNINQKFCRIRSWENWGQME